MRVLWRFRLLVGLGVCIALGLAVLTVVRVNPSGPHFSYRQNQQFASEAKVFVTQRGFPWGYASPPTVPLTAADAAASEATRLGSKQFADPTRFPSLAVLYAYLATSDPIKRIMRQGGPIKGEIAATPVVVTQSGYGTTLPLVSILATSTSPGGARALANRTTDAFSKFLKTQQTENQIPVQNRVLLTVLSRGDKAQLVKGRSKTLPVVVFITVLTAVVGLAFLLESMRPRVRPVTADEVARLPTKEQQSA